MPKARGGNVKCLYVKNCKLDGVYTHNSASNCNDEGESAKTTSVLENLRFEGVQISGYDYLHGTTRDTICVEGFENPQHYAKDIYLKDVVVCVHGIIIVFEFCKSIISKTLRVQTVTKPKAPLITAKNISVEATPLGQVFFLFRAIM